MIAATLDFQPRRRKARLRVGLPASLDTLDGRQAIALVNLSESGARVAVRDPEAIRDGILKWLDFEAFGSVVWRAEQTVGLHFEAPIEPAWVLETREWLPDVSAGKEEARRFAKAWVEGTGPDQRRAPAYSRHGQANVFRLGEAATWRPAMSDWLRAGKPFIAGGFVTGILAAYCSVRF